MKIKLFLPAILIFVLCCCSCSNEIDPNYLPSFDGIEVDENTIFLSNIKDDKKHIIYAVDTSNDKILYKYEFKNLIIYDMEYDASFDTNPYIVLLNGKAIKLNTKTGLCEKFSINFTPERVEVVGDKLWITPTGVGFEGSPKEYYIYDSKTNNTEYITLPEGLFRGDWTFINNCYYLALSISSYGDILYNLTEKKNIGGNFFNRNHSFYKLSGNYLQDSFISSASDYEEVYYINSFEPFNYKSLYKSDKYLLLINVFEKNNYSYFVEIGNNYLNITKRDIINNYIELKNIQIYDSWNYLTYCKNGYIWCVSEDNDGAYKVDMDDLSYEIINSKKQCFFLLHF